MKRTGNGFARWRRRATCLAAPFVLVAVCPSIASAGGKAVDALSDDGIELAGALPDRELDDLRGGFRVGGFDVAFGIEVRTIMNGVMEMVSRLNFTDRTGNKLVGNVSSVIGVTQTNIQGTLTSADVASIMAQVTQSGSGSATVTHDFTRGVLAIIQNQTNNVAVEQRITSDITVNNYAALVRNAPAYRSAQRAASQAAMFHIQR